jgi:hypothetical chaperone protein
MQPRHNHDSPSPISPVTGGRRRALGIDFGTTNSALAVVDDGGAPRLARFPTEHGDTDTFRSILYFEARQSRAGLGLDSYFAGPDAVRHYRLASHKGRFIQSLKTYLGDPGFTGTVISGRRRTVEELVGLILTRLLAAAAASLGPLPPRAVVGRPVHFTEARSAEEDDFAVARLREAFRLAGITEPIFEYEPVAAAYAYQQRLREPATVLIGDFGGGTSDFSILSLKPPAAAGSATPGDNGIAILGNEGLAFAGDAFDRQIVRHAVAPQLGKGSEYLSPPDKVLPTPEWVYSRLERWHHLSFLKSSTTLDMLQRVQRTSTAPDQIAALLHLVEENLGYELHEHVNNTKVTLSSAQETQLRFDLHPVAVEWQATRAEFERWLGPNLQAIDGVLDQLLARTGLAAADIDNVFLTGGSSFVPAVREIFQRKFGAERITGGQELTSVATGLALRAAAAEAMD